MKVKHIMIAAAFVVYAVLAIWVFSGDDDSHHLKCHDPATDSLPKAKR